MVSDFGAVVTIDNYCATEPKHAVVIYGPKGVILADHSLDALLTRQEIDGATRGAMGSVLWTADVRFAYSPDRRHLLLMHKLGRVVKLSLDTGRVVETGRPPTRAQPLG